MHNTRTRAHPIDCVMITRSPSSASRRQRNWLACQVRPSRQQISGKRRKVVAGHAALSITPQRGSQAAGHCRGRDSHWQQLGRRKAALCTQRRNAATLAAACTTEAAWPLFGPAL
jgi:hypothetical protein